MEGKDRQKGRDLPSLDISHFLVYLSTRNLPFIISTPALDLSPTLVHRQDYITNNVHTHCRLFIYIDVFASKCILKLIYCGYTKYHVIVQCALQKLHLQYSFCMYITNAPFYYTLWGLTAQCTKYVYILIAQYLFLTMHY